MGAKLLALAIGLTVCTADWAPGQGSIHLTIEQKLATLMAKQGGRVPGVTCQSRCIPDQSVVHGRELVRDSEASRTQPADIEVAERIPSGTRLQAMVLSRCEHIAYWNRPYQYDGVGDCYGYCRQVWNAILSDGKEHTEDYYPNHYDKKRWINFKGGIPVNTFPDTNWVYFSSLKVLVPGDLLATDEGHFWGPGWHGGIYAGNGDNWDCSRHDGLSGAYQRPLFSGFHYYFMPLHHLLIGKSPPRTESARR